MEYPTVGRGAYSAAMLNNGKTLAKLACCALCCVGAAGRSKRRRRPVAAAAGLLGGPRVCSPPSRRAPRPAGSTSNDSICDRPKPCLRSALGPQAMIQQTRSPPRSVPAPPDATAASRMIYPALGNGAPMRTMSRAEEMVRQRAPGRPADRPPLGKPLRAAAHWLEPARQAGTVVDPESAVSRARGTPAHVQAIVSRRKPPTVRP